MAVNRRTVENHLRRAAHRSPAALDRACDRLIESAADGESWQERMAAFSLLADRLDGKAKQAVEVSSGSQREIDLSEIVRMVLASRTQEAQDVECVSLPGADENHSRSDPAVQQDPPIPQIGEAGGVVEAGAPSPIAAKNEEPE